MAGPDSRYRQGAGPKVGGAAGSAAAIAAAIAIAAPVVKHWEGHSTVPHFDAVAHVWDVCYGDRAATQRIYTDAECDTLLMRRLARDYGPQVLKAVPAFIRPERKQQFAASIVMAYNVGDGRFSRTVIAERFRRGDWLGGCKAFELPDYAKVRGVVIRGLQNRRWLDPKWSEQHVCMVGLK